MTDLPVGFVRTRAAACVAELVVGADAASAASLYVFVDTFIGGGLVLDSHLRSGVHGNAGASRLDTRWPRAAERRPPAAEQLLAWPRSSTSRPCTAPGARPGRRGRRTRVAAAVARR